MSHWRVRYMRRGSEPPMPFGRTVDVVCASTREEAKRLVPASAGYPITASRTVDRVDYSYLCRCAGEKQRDDARAILHAVDGEVAP